MITLITMCKTNILTTPRWQTWYLFISSFPLYTSQFCSYGKRNHLLDFDIRTNKYKYNRSLPTFRRSWI